MNPPLRRKADITLLKEGVADGTIKVLATDHAPHPASTKETDFASASFGIVGLECALPLYRKALIDDGVLDWPAMLAMMTINPAKICGLSGKGRLDAGADGDVTIIDPAEAWTIDVDAFVGKSRNCPFDGWSVEGRAVATIVNGRIRMNRDADRWPAATTPDAASPADPGQ